MTVDYDDNDDCDRCGGEGWIMEADGDPSDWMEDTYCGSMDSTIECRVCKGTGIRHFNALSSYQVTPNKGTP